MVAPKDGKGSLNHGIGLSLVATAFAHPLAYVKVLVQVCFIIALDLFDKI